MPKPIGLICPEIGIVVPGINKFSSEKFEIKS